MNQAPAPSEVFAQLWALGELSPQALGYLRLTGCDPVLPSSFAVGTAAQVSIAAAALAACELGAVRGQARQDVAVDMAQAAMECQGWYSLDGVVPDPWDALSGLYRCADGWVRLHTNFAHHRLGVLALLGLPPSTGERDTVQDAVAQWRAVDLETQAAERGLVVAAVRSFEQWDAHAQGQAIAAQPLFTLERMADGPVLPLPQLGAAQRPLHGVRVLDLTRIVAGPVAGRTLAALGADVMLVNSPHLPNIDMIAEASRGKRSVHVDLRDPAQRQQMNALVAGSHVFVQGYRPGGLDALGYSPAQLAHLRPGLVIVSLSAYSEQGPWAGRRGFDSLVQTAAGFNTAEAQAAGVEKPQALPVQILDYATGYLMAFASSAALVRQQQEGGTWLVRVSLAQTAHWLRSMGQVAAGWGIRAPSVPERTHYLESYATGFGALVAMRHSAKLSRTPVGWSRPAMPPGSHPPVW
ncbi:CoA transferase [Rhodoferax aquaticus]|uniref:CoA transferase n=1 Tax=Rhodoferax aquaticus TaxID=2527691 RepID=A0A515ET12_9BURK|nr:CoA transferase [Rhodoferax aquaticus]QDL55809.1 CoA transferase [Rhodoferax aquaticus]